MGYHFKNLQANRAVLLLLACLMFFGCGVALAQTESSARNVIVESISLSGNDKTKDQIVLRELLFRTGDTLTQNEFSMLVYRSRQNILNTSLFNFVTIDTLLSRNQDDLLLATVSIILLERWYVWPVPIVKMTDRNFNAWWQSRDFTRINYGLDVKWYNFTGRMDELDGVIQFGKNHRLSLAYRNPYIDRNKHLGVGFEAGYSKNREVGYCTLSDKLVFAFLPEGLSFDKYLVINGYFRRNVYTTHELKAGIQSFRFSDSLLVLNHEYSYAGIKNPTFLNIYYKLKIDNRDIKYYPLKGWYADMELNKSGLGFSFEKPVDIFWAKATIRHYARVAERCYTGISVTGKISSGAWQPYFLMKGVGYNRDYVRGYEYNVIDGRHFGVIRSNIKYAIIPERTRNIGLIPTPKFSRIHYALYLTAFADAGYVWQPQWNGVYNNKLPQTLLAGAGLGIDMVTYYDKIVRVEYAVNKSGKSGIFIHFISGI